MDFAEQVEIEGAHPVVVGDARKEIHEDQLTVAFASVTRLLLCRSFLLGTTLHNDDGRCPTTSDGYNRVSGRSYALRRTDSL